MIFGYEKREPQFYVSRFSHNQNFVVNGELNQDRSGFCNFSEQGFGIMTELDKILNDYSPSDGGVINSVVT